MTRSFSQYTDDARIYLTTKLKIFSREDFVSADAVTSKLDPTLE